MTNTKTNQPTEPAITGQEWITRHFPDHRVYCDLTGGGIERLVAKPRCEVETVNDPDRIITNAFRIARDRLPELLTAILMTPAARAEYRAAHQRTNNQFEATRRFFVRAIMGTPGGKFHSEPRRSATAGERWGDVPQLVFEVSKRLQGVTVETTDPVVLITQHRGPKTLFFAEFHRRVTIRTRARIVAALEATGAMAIIQTPTRTARKEFGPDWRQIKGDDDRPRLWAHGITIERDLFNEPAGFGNPSGTP